MLPHPWSPRQPRSALEQGTFFETFARRCEHAWPGLRPARCEFIRWLTAELPSFRVGTFELPHATDVFLAFACMQGDPAALQVLDEDLLSLVGGYVARIHDADWFVDEVRQHLRRRLLAPDSVERIADLAGMSGAPLIGAHRGHGPLAAWIRAAAVRIGLSLARNPRLRVGPVDAMTAIDPEIEYVKTWYAAELRRALQAPLVTATAADRELVRRHCLEEQSFTTMSPALGMHPDNFTHRWPGMREAILEETRRHACGHSGMGDRELAGLLQLCRQRAA